MQFDVAPLQSPISYAAVLDRVFSLSKGQGILSLSNIEKLCEIYNSPQHAFATIHVAGTNGKGSVCTKIADALQAQGYVTGLYTSPHISTFRERIRVGGAMIAEEEMASLFCEIQESPHEATFFELATLLAFLYFRNKGVEVAVIETGLGGTWDATNVIAPLVSVITSIGFDHMEILGPTLADIAREKAGIMKLCVPVVLGPDVPYATMKERADALGCPLYQNTVRNIDFEWENRETARLALRILSSHFPLSEQAIEAGLKAKPPCRFERYRRENREIVFDVAHNAHGFNRLLHILEHTYPGYAYRFVVGFSKGKDIAEIAQLIERKACRVHVVDGPHPRLAKTSEFQHAFSNAQIEPTIAQGFMRALQAMHEKEVLVIAGSFFIMCEARKAIGLCDAEDPYILYDITPSARGERSK